MVFAIHLGFSALAWHSPVRSPSSFPYKNNCMRTWIKICGTTSLEDALSSIEAGADALGFIFAESKRRILPENAQKIPPEELADALLGVPAPDHRFGNERQAAHILGQQG